MDRVCFYNDGVSSSAVPSFNIAGKVTLTDQSITQGLTTPANRRDLLQDTQAIIPTAFLYTFPKTIIKGLYLSV